MTIKTTSATHIGRLRTPRAGLRSTSGNRNKNPNTASGRITTNQGATAGGSSAISPLSHQNHHSSDGIEASVRFASANNFDGPRIKANASTTASTNVAVSPDLNIVCG